MNEIVSVILSVILIALGVYYYNTQVAKTLDEKQFMVKTLFMILFIMILLFVSDKLFFAYRQLLSKEANLALFGLIEKLMLIMFGFYFGSREK